MKANTLPGLPAIVLEELTHMAAASPYADIDVRIGEQPPLRFTWAESTPTWWIYLTHLAPTILGAVLTVLAALLAVPEVIVSITLDPFTTAAVGVLAAYNWLLYVWPSYEDRHPFAGGDA